MDAFVRLEDNAVAVGEASRDFDVGGGAQSGLYRCVAGAFVCDAVHRPAVVVAVERVERDGERAAFFGEDEVDVNAVGVTGW